MRPEHAPHGWVGAITALRAIRPDIPIILASGYDEASVMQGDHTERPQAFLAKPFGPPDLRKAIAKTLPGRWEDTTGDSASDAEGKRLFPHI